MGTLSGWSEAILLSLLFVALLGFAVIDLNRIYSQNYGLGFGDNSTESMFLEYTESSQSNIEGGEASLQSNQGITLKNSYAILKDAVKLMWSFITGGWIEHVVNMLNLGEAGVALSKTLRVLFVLSLIFAVLYALFKVTA
jgi:hypothetical protein